MTTITTETGTKVQTQIETQSETNAIAAGAIETEKTESQVPQEMTLDDQHITLLQDPSALNPMADPQNISLPAALCDDKLLEEINTIPDKMGFKIGEVADMLGIKQYVLRYWESEFEILKPKKASNNQRYYTKKDVENAYLIRKLLHRDRFSIEGARAALKDLKNFVRSEVKKEKVISTISQKLESIHDQVDDLLIHIRRTKQIIQMSQV